MNAERGERLQVSLNTRTPAAVRTGDGERDRLEFTMGSLARNLNRNLNLIYS